MGNLCPCGAGFEKMVTRSGSLMLSDAQKQGKLQHCQSFKKLARSSCAQKEDVSAIYEVEKELGSGAFGVVKRCRNKKSGAIRVVKTMHKDSMPDEESLCKMFNEISLQADLDHPNICKVFEVFDDHVHLHVVNELCEGGDLCDKLLEVNVFSELETFGLMKQIMHAVTYMHSKEIAHRDIKPENFLLKDKGDNIVDNTVKMIDFGFATEFKAQQQSMSTALGTPWYTAPEVLEGPYNELCDVYSCGVMLYMFLCGAPPFDAEETDDILEKAKAGHLDFNDKSWAEISGTAKHTIMWMMKRDASKRWSAQEVLECPWMQKEEKSTTKPSNISSSVLVSNMKQIRTTNAFTRAAMTCVAKALDDSSIKDLRDQFHAIDTDGNGVITFEEMKKACQNSQIDCADLETLFKEADTDGNGHFEWTEFLTCMLQVNQMKETDALWEAFCVFDSDGSGQISSSEMKEMLSVQHVDLDEAALDKLIAQHDQNGDNMIDFEEFMQLFNVSNEKRKWRATMMKEVQQEHTHVALRRHSLRVV